MTTLLPTLACTPTDRGTMRGVGWHLRHDEPLCVQCRLARADYTSAVLARYSAPAPAGCSTAWHARRLAFLQDYFDLLESGETHEETLAARLGTTPATLVYRLHRLGVQRLHTEHEQNHARPGRARSLRQRGERDA